MTAARLLDCRLGSRHLGPGDLILAGISAMLYVLAMTWMGMVRIGAGQ